MNHDGNDKKTHRGALIVRLDLQIKYAFSRGSSVSFLLITNTVNPTRTAATTRRR